MRQKSRGRCMGSREEERGKDGRGRDGEEETGRAQTHDSMQESEERHDDKEAVCQEDVRVVLFTHLLSFLEINDVCQKERQSWPSFSNSISTQSCSFSKDLDKELHVKAEWQLEFPRDTRWPDWEQIFSWLCYPSLTLVVFHAVKDVDTCLETMSTELQEVTCFFTCHDTGENEKLLFIELYVLWTGYEWLGWLPSFFLLPLLLTVSCFRSLLIPLHTSFLHLYLLSFSNLMMSWMCLVFCCCFTSCLLLLLCWACSF